MIPKILHHIWIGDFKIPIREQRIIEEVKSLHSDYEYMFWREPPELPNNVREWYDKFYKIKNYVFCADLLRVWVIYTYGGFYLDVDWDIKKKLDSFLPFDGVFFYHNDTDFTIPNNLFGTVKHSPVLSYCLEKVQSNCSWYGPSWFGMTIKEYLKLPYESPQNIVLESLRNLNIEYYKYYQFEMIFGKHLSLYSWCPEMWEKLNRGDQL